jgi:hypothetical protein
MVPDFGPCDVAYVANENARYLGTIFCWNIPDSCMKTVGDAVFKRFPRVAGTGVTGNSRTIAEY